MLAPALTILLSSFLLFLVQPIIAKQILPWFGGSAGVWTICLVFFQLVLLLGYSYAHWLTRRRADSRQFVLHMVLLLVSCLTLPIIAGPFWKPVHDHFPALQILGLLAATVGLPYFLLASTAPLLQRWLSDTISSDHPRALDLSPVRAVEFGLAGGLAQLSLRYRAVRDVAHAGVGLELRVCDLRNLPARLCLRAVAAPGHRSCPDNERSSSTECTGARASMRYWIGCAALGSILLLSVTHHITENVAAIPFLWIAPLSLYLLSFIICFEGRSGRGWYERRFWILPAMLATPGHGVGSVRL